jgi:hypothetical protein
VTKGRFEDRVRSRPRRRCATPPPTLAVVGAGSGLPVHNPILSHSPSVTDRNVLHITSTTNTPPMPSTATTTPTATDTAPAPTPDLDLTDLLHMLEDGLSPDLDFDLDFLQISNDMAAVFPSMAGMEPFAPGSYGDAGGPSSAVYAPDSGLPPLPRPPISPTRSVLTPLDVNTGSKCTAAHLEEVNSAAPAKKQSKKCSNAGIARGPCKYLPTPACRPLMPYVSPLPHAFIQHTISTDLYLSYG